MIAYFDTSALVPLLVDEPGSEIASRLWAPTGDADLLRAAPHLGLAVSSTVG